VPEGPREIGEDGLVSISDISYNRADILCQNIPQMILLKLRHGRQDVADGVRHP
jgi:hypothetical protein